MKGKMAWFPWKWELSGTYSRETQIPFLIYARYGRQKCWSLKNVHILLPRPVNILGCMAKVADKLRLSSQLTLRCRDYLGLSGWVQCNYKGSEMRGKGSRQRENQRGGNMRRPWPDGVCIEDGGSGHKPGMWQPLEAGKGEKMDSPLEPLEKNTTLRTPWF